MWKQLPEATRNALCREVPTSAPEASLERIMRDFIQCQLSFRCTGAMGGLLTIFTEANCYTPFRVGLLYTNETFLLERTASFDVMKHGCLKA